MPEAKVAESNPNVTPEQETSGDAAAKTETSASNLPTEVASALANLNSDLHWLVQCGHIIEFYKGNIQVAPKKIAPPPPKNKDKTKKEKTGAKESSENNAVNTTESNAEVKVEESVKTPTEESAEPSASSIEPSAAEKEQ